jgi:hypothetical protein
VGSAQLKIVLDNLWTLKTFEKNNATSRLQFRIHRSHLSPLESAIAGAS